MEEKGKHLLPGRMALTWACCYVALLGQSTGSLYRRITVLSFFYIILTNVTMHMPNLSNQRTPCTLWGNAKWSEWLPCQEPTVLTVQQGCRSVWDLEDSGDHWSSSVCYSDFQLEGFHRYGIYISSFSFFLFLLYNYSIWISILHMFTGKHILIPYPTDQLESLHLFK